MSSTATTEETTETSCSPGEQTDSPSTTTTTPENQTGKCLCFRFRSHYAISDFKGESDNRKFPIFEWFYSNNIEFTLNKTLLSSFHY